MITGTNLTVRLTPELRAALNDLAAAEGSTPADIVRRAIQLYELTAKGGTDLDRRRQFTFEFLFLFADWYLKNKDRTVHADLAAEADRRVNMIYAPA